jgi:hypothetical protein
LFTGEGILARRSYLLGESILVAVAMSRLEGKNKTKTNEREKRRKK